MFTVGSKDNSLFSSLLKPLLSLVFSALLLSFVKVSLASFSVEPARGGLWKFPAGRNVTL